MKYQYKVWLSKTEPTGNVYLDVRSVSLAAYTAADAVTQAEIENRGYTAEKVEPV